MSERESYKGVLTPTGKNMFQSLVEVGRLKQSDVIDDDDLKDMFFDTFLHQKVVVDGSVYDVDRDEFEEDVFYSKENCDGSIDFVVSYHNGGMCFSDAIEESMKHEKPKSLKFMLKDSEQGNYISEDEINLSHPLKTKRYDLHNLAMTLVSERHEKADLAMLVNHLLYKIEGMK